MAPWENYQVKRFDQYSLSLFFKKKSHIHTISAKHSKIKRSRPVHIIEVPKREKKRESDSIFQEIMAKNFPDYA